MRGSSACGGVGGDQRVTRSHALPQSLQPCPSPGVKCDKGLVNLGSAGYYTSAQALAMLRAAKSAEVYGFDDYAATAAYIALNLTLIECPNPDACLISTTNRSYW